MGLLSSLARLVLILINIVFLLVGLAITIVGFILRYGSSVYNKVLEIGMHQLEKVLKDTQFGNIDLEQIDLGKALESLAIGFIVGGLVLMALSFLGCCGACYKLEIMLWLYAIVIVVFIVLEGVAIGLLYGKPDLVKDNVKKSVKKYKGLGSAEVISVSWNIVMIQFQCCGVEGYKDFAEATDWNKDPGKTGTPTLLTPVACCKTLPTDKGVTCAASPFNEALNNGNTGCFKVLWDKSFNKTAIAVPVLVVCGIIQLAFIVFAIYIIKSEKNSVSPI